MTSVSTIAAAVPPALALGPGAETRIPMAVAVIGGVTLSTLLTLFVVPAAYLLLAPLEKKETYRRWRGNLSSAKERFLAGVRFFHFQ
jgi:HAE1 family hydrophobic/amphiphilic exporter-1